MKIYVVRADVCDYDGCSTALIKGFKSEEMVQTFCDLMNKSLEIVRNIINKIRTEYDEKVRSIPEHYIDPFSEEGKIFYGKRNTLSKEYYELKKQVEDRYFDHFGIRFDKDLSYE